MTITVTEANEEDWEFVFITREPGVIGMAVF